MKQNSVVCFVLAVLTLSNCSSNPALDHSRMPANNKHAQAGASDSRTIPPPATTVKAPFVETFQQNGKTLVYIGAVHHSSVQYPDATKDPIFETINKVFTETQFDVVIVEGVDPAYLTGFLQFAEKCAAAQYNVSGSQCDEPELTSHLASAAGIPVFTGEASASTELSSFQAQGYSVQDYLAFNLMRNIPVQNNHVPLNANTFPTFETSRVQSAEQLLGVDVPFGVNEFSAWYQKNMPVPANYLNLSTNNTGPLPDGPNGTFTVMNKFSAVDNNVRDGNVVSTIQEALQKYNRVLVVYGASHIDFEWVSLVKMMGIPTQKKLF